MFTKEELARAAQVARDIQADADAILEPPAYNPFAAKLARYKQYLANVEAEQARHDKSDMPGSYVTGNSGIPASRRRKVDAQLEATVKRAGKIAYWRQQVAWVQAKHDAYARGECDAQGRTIRVKDKQSDKLPVFENVADRIFCHQAMTGMMWSDRRVRPSADYKPIVLVFNDDHRESWYPGKFPPDLIEEVKRQVAAHKASHVAYKDRAR